jgi:hypothetical protein
MNADDGLPMVVDHKPSNSISSEEAAARMGVTVQRVRQIVLDPYGAVSAWKSPKGGRWYVDPVTVDSWVDERRRRNSLRLRPTSAGDAAVEGVPRPTDDAVPAVDVPDNVHDLLVRAAEERSRAAELELQVERAEHAGTRRRLEVALRALASLEERARRAEERCVDLLAVAEAQNGEAARMLRLLARDVEGSPGSPRD